MMVKNCFNDYVVKIYNAKISYMGVFLKENLISMESIPEIDGIDNIILEKKFKNEDVLFFLRSVLDLEELKIKKIENALDSAGKWNRFLFQKKMFRLMSFVDESRKRIRDVYINKRFIEKKIKRIKGFIEKIECGDVNNVIFYDYLPNELRFVERQSGLDFYRGDTKMEIYYFLKKIDSKNTFDYKLNISEIDTLPVNLNRISKDTFAFDLCLNETVGQGYTKLININDILPTGEVRNNNVMAFKKKEDLLKFINSLEGKYREKIKSIKESLIV